MRVRLHAASRGFFARLETFCRTADAPRSISDAVAGILAEVKAKGDAAVERYARRFDGATFGHRRFRVTAAEIARGAAELPPSELKALRSAHASIAAFHRRGRPQGWTGRNPHGATVGEKFDPIRRVGLYIPGGEVPLVSTVLMTATLARIAGCPEIAAFTPTRGDGAVAPGILAALRVAGVSEVYRIGGVPAVGAMAYGTGAVRPVDKIFGPGNAYVCEAKRQVFGAVGVDSLPGPSEVMIIADASARPAFAAADLLAQAEHGSGREKIYLVTVGRTAARIADAIEQEVARQAAGAGRTDKIARVLDQGWLIAEAGDFTQAAAIANAVAPEHLQLMVAAAPARALTRTITTAGAIFVGNYTPTVLGDFVAGPSHVLPTARAARFSSGLRMEDFLRRTSLVAYTRENLRRAVPTAAAFAAMERLDAHGRSAVIRFDE